MRFILYTRTKWDEAPRARHQLALALSSNHPVVFIEGNSFGLGKISKRQIKPNLKIFSPKWFVPYKLRFRLPFVNEVYQYWLLMKIKIEINKYILINFDHSGTIISKKLFRKKVYYCNDDHIITSSFSLKLLKIYFRYCEKLVAINSDLCIATANSLKDKLLKYNINTYTIKLGAPTVNDDVHLSYASSIPIKVAFVGFVGSNNDLKIFTKILENENYELHLFGEISSKYLRSLKQFQNFHFHGIKINSDLHKELNKCNIGIAPYTLSDENTGITPNKLWLYLAVGLPVVVTEVKNIRDWNFPHGFVYKSKDNKDFFKLIELSHNENSRHLFNKRIEYAKENNWNERANNLINIYLKTK